LEGNERPVVNTRSCGTCTKCCEGYVSASVRGIPFFKGNPCHFVSIGKGCSIYEDRPKQPCKSYSCFWLKSEDVPEWMKPSEINAMISERYTKNNIYFLELIEAGETLRADVLSWLINYCNKNDFNLFWEVNGKKNYMGSDEFLKEFDDGGFVGFDVMKNYKHSADTYQALKFFEKEILDGDPSPLVSDYVKATNGLINEMQAYIDYVVGEDV